MPMPVGYEEAKVRGEHERLKVGGHRCMIVNCAMELSKNGNKMIVMAFDTDPTDSQPGYYMNRYKSDQNRDKTTAKYQGVYRLIIDDRLMDKNQEAYGLTNLKTLMTGIEHSNEGFTIDWTYYGTNDVEFCKQLARKKIGIVFREEEYEANDGSIRSSVKPMYTCSYEKAEGANIPKKKEVQREYTGYVPATGAAGAEGFMQYNDPLNDVNLPFN